MKNKSTHWPWNNPLCKKPFIWEVLEQDSWATIPSDPRGKWQFQKLKAVKNYTNFALWWHVNGEWEIPFNLMQFKHQPRHILVAQAVFWSYWFRPGWVQLSCPLILRLQHPLSATSCPSSGSLHWRVERGFFWSPKVVDLIAQVIKRAFQVPIQTNTGSTHIESPIISGL